VSKCTCTGPNPDCRRAGQPMVGRLYELCSGNCPTERPCPPELCERYRIMWDNKPAAGETTEPGFVSKALSFGSALVAHAATGFERVPPEVHAERRALCDACEHHNPDNDTCRKCGCYLSRLGGKLAMASEACPIGKWGTYSKKEGKDADNAA
jgi:hypothetical protein